MDADTELDALLIGQKPVDVGQAPLDFDACADGECRLLEYGNQRVSGCAEDRSFTFSDDLSAQVRLQVPSISSLLDSNEIEIGGGGNAFQNKQCKGSSLLRERISDCS